MPRDRTEYNRRYYRENRERLLEKQKEHYQKNREERKAYLRSQEGRKKRREYAREQGKGQGTEAKAEGMVSKLPSGVLSQEQGEDKCET